MTAPPLCVETDLDLRQTSRNGHLHPEPVPRAAALRWDPTDPWAVTLDFEGGVSWTIGWELLVAVVGGEFCAGVADVRIWRGARVFRLVLQSPDGSAMFEADPVDVVCFVEAVQPRHRLVADRPWIPATVAELLDAIQHATEETR